MSATLQMCAMRRDSFHSGIILIDSSKITVARNVVRNSRDGGIEINSSSDNMVIGNMVTGNTWGIVLVEGSSRNVIMSNRVRVPLHPSELQTIAGFKSSRSHQVTHTYNWDPRFGLAVLSRYRIAGLQFYHTHPLVRTRKCLMPTG